MPSEKGRGALSDMLRHIDLAEQFSKGHGYESLRDNLQALYAAFEAWRSSPKLQGALAMT